MEMTIPADPLYQLLLLAAEKKFWRCVETGEPPSPLWHRAAIAYYFISSARLGREPVVDCIGDDFQ